MASVIINGATFPPLAVRDPLRGLLPDWVLDETRTEIRVPERVRCLTCEEESATPSALVKIGSNPQPGLIVLHPEFYIPNTATGEALRAHELYHIMQRRSIPDFEQKFVQAALKTEREGLPPWENPYEKPAYEFEQRVKEMLSYQGYEE